MRTSSFHHEISTKIADIHVKSNLRHDVIVVVCPCLVIISIFGMVSYEGDSLSL